MSRRKPINFLQKKQYKGGDSLARPLKSGIDYFSLDTGFLRDKKIKLLKSKYGTKGIVILIAVLSRVYEENGYFKPWDEDDCFLMSDDVGCGCTPKLVEEVVQECVKRSVFDAGILSAFGVLTSPGIQRRFLRAVATRDEITMIREYFLLDINNRRDVQESVRKKLTLESVSSEKTPVSFEKTPAFSTDNPQSKVNQSKGEERKVNEDTSSPDKPVTRARQQSFIPPTVDEVRAYCMERKNGIDPEYWVDSYASKGWMVGKTKMVDWKAAVRTWERNSGGIPHGRNARNTAADDGSGGRVFGGETVL